MSFINITEVGFMNISKITANIRKVQKNFNYVYCTLSVAGRLKEIFPFIDCLFIFTFNTYMTYS